MNGFIVGGILIVIGAAAFVALLWINARLTDHAFDIDD